MEDPICGACTGELAGAGIFGRDDAKKFPDGAGCGGGGDGGGAGGGTSGGVDGIAGGASDPAVNELGPSALFVRRASKPRNATGN
jgi:hypothetical protein